MKIGDLWRRRQDDAAAADETPRGPWSDPPPSGPPPGPSPWGAPFGGAPRAGRSKPRRRAREPIVSNWRGLLIVVLLLLVAPLLARWASAVIMGLMPGH